MSKTFCLFLYSPICFLAFMRALSLQVQCCEEKGVGCLAKSRSNWRIWSSGPGWLGLLDTHLEWLCTYPWTSDLYRPVTDSLFEIRIRQSCVLTGKREDNCREGGYSSVTARCCTYRCPDPSESTSLPSLFIPTLTGNVACQIPLSSLWTWGQIFLSLWSFKARNIFRLK